MNYARSQSSRANKLIRAVAEWTTAIFSNSLREQMVRLTKFRDALTIDRERISRETIKQNAIGALFSSPGSSLSVVITRFEFKAHANDKREQTTTKPSLMDERDQSQRDGLRIRRAGLNWRNCSSLSLLLVVSLFSRLFSLSLSLVHAGNNASGKQHAVQSFIYIQFLSAKSPGLKIEAQLRLHTSGEERREREWKQEMKDLNETRKNKASARYPNNRHHDA